MSLNCSICPSHCCGKSAVKPPILLPFELDGFVRADIYTENGVVFRLRHSDETGCCKYLDPNQQCTVYNMRPIECQLYPYIMRYDFDTKVVSLELHPLCPQGAEADMPIIPEEVKTVSEEFWKGFMESPIV